MIEPLLPPTRHTWDKERDPERRDFDLLEVLQRACERTLSRFDDANVYMKETCPPNNDVQKGLNITRRKIDVGRG